MLSQPEVPRRAGARATAAALTSALGYLILLAVNCVRTIAALVNR